MYDFLMLVVYPRYSNMRMLSFKFKFVKRYMFTVYLSSFYYIKIHYIKHNNQASIPVTNYKHKRYYINVVLNKHIHVCCFLVSYFFMHATLFIITAFFTYVQRITYCIHSATA